MEIKSSEFQNQFEPYKLKKIDEHIYQADGESISFCALCFTLRMYVVQLLKNKDSPDEAIAGEHSRVSSTSDSFKGKRGSTRIKPRSSNVQSIIESKNADDGRREGYDLWLFSPIQPNPELIQQIKSLANPMPLASTKISSSLSLTTKKSTTIYIVYGNSLHHMYAEAWIKAFQEDGEQYQVKIAGPQQLVDKMIQFKRDELKFDYIIDEYDNNSTTVTTSTTNQEDQQSSNVTIYKEELPWNDQIKHITLSTNGFMHEILFYHVPSQSLLLTDLIQNHTLQTSSGYNSNLKFIYNTVGISRDVGGGIPVDFKMGFHWPFSSCTIDYTRYILQNDVIEKWDFDKILITHGDNIYDGAKEYFEMFVRSL